MPFTQRGAAGLARIMIGVMSGGTLAACTPSDPAAPDTCGAAPLQALVGEDRGRIAGLQLQGPVRVIEPGMAVTMDYRAERLNFWIDEGGRIERITCS
ncbi:I78 family peptidase inhibitor [Pseudogemmobacter sonorensis]|uniref:I78 family peptidase inhibitor n=1 Tax=Pseudogemmobacter sonorensis TaxID=2989681 RepID=UPI0036B2F931